jgi:hypothetical protein
MRRPPASLNHLIPWSVAISGEMRTASRSFPRRCLTKTVVALGVTLFVMGAIAPAATLLAQSPNFITPGASNRSADLPDKGSLDAQIEDAPWKTGIFRFSPWFGVRDASVVTGTNVGDGTDDTDDFTVTIGAGIRGYLRGGPKVVLAGHILPEFTWWADDSDRNRLNGRFGLGLFAYFNRLELELSHRLVEEQGFFSSEVQRLTPTRHETTRAIADVRVSDRLYLTLRGVRRESGNEEEDTDLVSFLSQLDRTDEMLQALIGYRAPGGWRFAIGYEDASSSFDSFARPLSNDATGLIVETGFQGNRFDGVIEVAFRDLEPTSGSTVRAASETTGLVEAIWSLSPRSALLTYGRRTLSYSVTSGASYFIGDRFGLRWQGLWDRVGLGLWAETGEDRFESLAGDTLERTDDVTSFGAIGTFSLRAVQLQLTLQTSDFSTPAAAFDRDVTTFGFSFQIEPLNRLLNRASERLRIGQARSTW